jgi:pimeloyl-ACP methyl ester carboxylesterase
MKAVPGEAAVPSENPISELRGNGHDSASRNHLAPAAVRLVRWHLNFRLTLFCFSDSVRNLASLVRRFASWLCLPPPPSTVRTMTPISPCVRTNWIVLRWSVFFLSVCAFAQTGLPLNFSKLPSALNDPQHYYLDTDQSIPLGDKTPLILVHGISLDGGPPSVSADGWDNFAFYFYSTPALSSRYKLYRFAYQSNQLSVDILGYYLSQLLNANDDSASDQHLAGKNIVVLAHSMGGLVARRFMEEQRGTTMKWNQSVARLITLATPHHGTPAANKCEYVLLPLPDYVGALGYSLGHSFGTIDFAIEAAGLSDLGHLFEHMPNYDGYNRSDLLWDNYDGLFKGGFAAGEQKTATAPGPSTADLNAIDGARSYDNKIIAYAGTFTDEGGHPAILTIPARILRNGLGIPNDGIVPLDSAWFQGRVSGAQQRFFDDYDHFQLMESKTIPGDLPSSSDILFTSIKNDLVAALPPSAPSNLTVTAVSSSQVDLSWADNSSTEAGFKIERATSRSGPWTSVASTVADAVAFSDAGRAAGTTYYYRVKAFNSVGGDSDPSNVASAGTLASAIRVDFVFPGTLTGLPLPQTQPLHIYGTGFTSTSTLLFNGTIASDPARLHFINASEIDYDIRTDVVAANWTVQVINGSLSSNLGYFTVVAPPPPSVGSLSVSIQPSAAVSAGAQWQVDGGGYHNSGDVVTGLTPGSHTIACKAIAGYAAPASHSVSIVGGTVTSNTETYTSVAPSTYSLTLNYDSNQGTASAWPAATGGVYTAGTVVQLSVSTQFNHHFTGWSGAISGTTTPTTIVMDGNKSVTANFAAGDPSLGTVAVTIQPAAAAAAGVTWGLNANDFRTSGSSYTTSPATYLLTLHPVDGWLGPLTIVATLTAGQTTNVTATFTADTTPGLLTVTLSPPDATSAGAHWHANGGSAQSNGATLSLLPGSYTVTFDPVTGWTAPSSQTVQVLRSQTTVVAATYIPPAGQPGIVSVQPSFGALAGGTPLTIQGSNFVAPAIVTVGGKSATNVTVVNGSQITCQTPASTVYGTAAVVVQTAGGTATNQTGFAYGLPHGNGIVLTGSIGGCLNAVAAQGNYGYVGEGSTFTVLDVSNAAAPTPVGRLAIPGLIQDIALFTVNNHQYAAVADDDAGLQIVDVTTAATPTLRGYYGSGDRTYGVAVVGTYAYVGDGNAGFKVLDLSDPTKPQLVGSVAASFANRMSIQTVNNQRLAYLVSNGGLQIIDVTNSTNPVLRGHTAQLLTQWYLPNSIATSGNRAFLADGFGYLQSVDIGNPDSPSALGSLSSDAPSAVCIANGLIYTWGTLGLQIYNFPGGQAQRIGATYVSGQLSGNSIAVVGGKALCSGGERGLYLYDVSTLSNPSYRGAYGVTAGYYNYVALNGNYAWFSTQNSGLRTFDLSNPASPILVSQYYSSFNSGFGGEGIKVVGNRAYYLASGQINVLDVSNPRSPVFLGATSQSTFTVVDFYVVGSSIVAAGADTTTVPYEPAIAVFNASNPASMSIQGRLDFPVQGGGALTSIAGNSSIACVAIPLTNGSNNSLAVIDVSSPGALRQIGDLSDIGFLPLRALRLAPDNRYLYVGGYQTDLSWKIIDLVNQNAPAQVSSTNVGAAVYGFDFAGTIAYLATGKGILVYDVSDPSHPQSVRSYSMPIVPFDVKVSGTNLYVGATQSGLTILTLSDIDPPAAVITNPTSSSTWTNTTGTLNLSGTAGDNTGLIHGTVTQVTWSNSRGGGGNASGTANWSVNGVTLQPGTNVLTVTATDAAGNSGNATLTVTYQSPKQDQTITFPSITDHTFGDPPVPLVAATSSGLNAQFGVVSGPATLVNNVLTLTGAGTVTVEASQPGNDAFNPATPVDMSFNVARADQSIAFAPVADQSASTSPFALTASTSSGLQVYFNIVSGPAVIDGNIITILGVGTVVVNAWQPGSANYNAATTVQRSFRVTAMPQTVTFGALSQQHVGDAPFTLSATASSGLPVSYSVLSGPATISGNAVIITGAGTVTIRASQSGDATYSAAANVDQSFIVAEAPAITTPPQNQQVIEGNSITFTVAASGYPIPTYQWQKDGTVIVGATGSSYTITNALLADAGNYTVVVTNSAGSKTSDPAMLTVIPAGTSVTHTVVGAGYVAGGTVTISNTLTYTGTATALGWQVLPPNGWSFVSDGGSAGNSKPTVGSTDLLEWAWTTTPASPVTFTYTLNVPAGTTGDQTLQSLAIVRLQNVTGPLQLLVKPDPLVIGPATYHAADTDRNWRLSLLELTRVIELYNTRNGTSRTGCYKIDAAGEDGFAPEPMRTSSATVTLASYHSADSDKNGKISLLELTRVIELYNYRSGTTRTGQYHVQAGTEDGFAPGP